MSVKHQSPQTVCVTIHWSHMKAQWYVECTVNRARYYSEFYTSLQDCITYARYAVGDAYNISPVDQERYDHNMAMHHAGITIPRANFTPLDANEHAWMDADYFATASKSEG